ncbi:hypothetical protein L2E82_42198 [Cichorium intybus]|uniref:Uncharacterized protein n=1 Tax=Cichorium intybus TaxID=13427 RepID=A0ACB8ZR13_CICIN|nr:hypothetical protein L2E82_42198 [Cichorium intybus]
MHHQTTVEEMSRENRNATFLGFGEISFIFNFLCSSSAYAYTFGVRYSPFILSPTLHSAASALSVLPCRFPLSYCIASEKDLKPLSSSILQLNLPFGKMKNDAQKMKKDDTL